MGWCIGTAMNAYLDTLNLCRTDHERRCCSFWNPGLHSSELISALAAGTNSQLIIEVCSTATSSTIALAAAARQTGGHFLCILSTTQSLPQSVERMKPLHLLDDVEFVVGDAKQLVSEYSCIDFAVIDCKNEKSVGLFELLHLNPDGAIVTGKNLFNPERRVLFPVGGAKSKTQNFGNGLQITRIMSEEDLALSEMEAWRIDQKRRRVKSHMIRNRWIVEIDKQTGEEHVFLVPKNRARKYMHLHN